MSDDTDDVGRTRMLASFARANAHFGLLLIGLGPLTGMAAPPVTTRRQEHPNLDASGEIDDTFPILRARRWARSPYPSGHRSLGFAAMAPMPIFATVGTLRAVMIAFSLPIVASVPLVIHSRRGVEGPGLVDLMGIGRDEDDPHLRETAPRSRTSPE